MIAAMPGGIAGVKEMIAGFHRRGVRVLFPMMMWDQGTRDPGKPWPQAIAELMKEIGADGINGDTQDGVPVAFSEAAEKIGHPLAFEPEGSPSDEALAWNVLTWGQYGGQFPFVPGCRQVSLARTAPHGEYLRPLGARRRPTICSTHFSMAKAGKVGKTSGASGTASRRATARPPGEWPLWSAASLLSWSARIGNRSTRCIYYGVYASRWPLAGETVWTIVNRNEYDVDARQMSAPAAAGMRYFDLYHGVELTPKRDRGARSVLSFALEAHGYGAILATRLNEPAQTIRGLMDNMKTSWLQSHSRAISDRVENTSPAPRRNRPD